MRALWLCLLFCILPAACRAQADADLSKAPRHTLREAETDLSGFIEKPFTVTGRIDVFGQYYYRYSEAEKTHFAFTIFDGGTTAYCYMSRDVGAALRKRLVDAGESLRGDFTLVIYARRYQEGQNAIVAELLSFKPHTPDPDAVKASQARAVARYPDLGIAGSAFNLKFVALYNQLLKDNDTRLEKFDWLERIAGRCFVSGVDSQ